MWFKLYRQEALIAFCASLALLFWYLYRFVEFCCGEYIRLWWYNIFIVKLDDTVYYVPWYFEIPIYRTSLSGRHPVAEDGCGSFIITLRPISELTVPHQEFIDLGLWVDQGQGHDSPWPRRGWATTAHAR